MLSWKAIFRPYDAWWPLRPAFRLSPSCQSKIAPHMYLYASPFISLKYTFAELLVTGMHCHSKVWSRVWTHRCNVNMNPYISVCPFSVCIIYPSCPSCPSVAAFFYLCSAFISGFKMSTSKGRLCCFTLFSRAVRLD